MSFARWLRARSEQQLMAAAERQVAVRHGLPAPPPPRGVDVFWQRVYVPAYNRLPWRLRAVVMKALPGSHRRTWHKPEEAQGPAV
jgi:hypothetical protein